MKRDFLTKILKFLVTIVIFYSFFTLIYIGIYFYFFQDGGSFNFDAAFSKTLMFVMITSTIVSTIVLMRLKVI